MKRIKTLQRNGWFDSRAGSGQIQDVPETGAQKIMGIVKRTDEPACRRPHRLSLGQPEQQDTMGAGSTGKTRESMLTATHERMSKWGRSGALNHSRVPTIGRG